MKLTYRIDSELNGRTVKSVLRNELNLGSSLTKKLKYNDKIMLNGSSIRTIDRVKTGDFIEVFLDFEEESENVTPQKMNMDILFEDDWLIAVNKQPNIVIHPTCYHPDNTMANGLMHYFQSKNLNIKIRPVSRLDRDTTGVVVFAKNQFVQDFLIKQMREKIFLKEYLGIIRGYPSNEKGTIDMPIARKAGSIIERCVSEEGAPSITHYYLIEKLKDASLLRFQLETGRTHQIRVHCQAVGNPLLGDTLYGEIVPENSVDEIYIPPRQMLHSCMVKFIHPYTKKQLIISSLIPNDFKKTLEILRK